jgi:DNA helicase II / ATP-dependent DNA helicase PcrA
LKGQAVLFRASHHSAQLEIELSRRNIPFVKYGGLKFLETAHVKDVISVFRWCENPADRVAGFRVLQLLPGIGPATAARIQDPVEARPGRSDTLASIDVPKAAAEDWPGFAKAAAGRPRPVDPRIQARITRPMMRSRGVFWVLPRTLGDCARR